MAKLTEEYDKETIGKILKKGIDSEFWAVLNAALEENLLDIDAFLLLDIEDFDQYTAEECKVRILNHNSRRRYLTQMLELPSNIYASFDSGKIDVFNPDPYNTSEDFLPKKENK